MNELSVFANWRSEYIEVQTTMVTLGYTPVEMYYVLRSLLGGKAKQMIMVKEPNADTYQKSIDLLNDAFYSKALHVRDIVYRLKMLPVMDPSSATKNQLWKTEAFNLMVQLSEMTQDSQDELKFLLFSEILLPKLNSEANKLWEKKITDESNISEEAHLGHTLGMDDLKKVIAKSTQILQQRELNKFYNGKKLPSNSDSGKKDDDKKKSEKKHEKEDYLSHSTTLTNEKAKNNNQKKGRSGDGQPRNSSSPDVCPFPSCKIPTSGDNAHAYMLQCDKLRNAPAKDVVKFFKDYKCKCHYCFSLKHKTEDCKVRTKKPCEKTLKYGPNAGKPCGQHHNVYLHVEENPAQENQQKPKQ